MDYYRKQRGSFSSVVFLGVFIFFLILWCFIRIVAYISFDRNCGGYLKRAADANTVKIAETQLEKAVYYMEQERLTEGYTSVFYKTPDEDIGFWYVNIKTALMELETLAPESTPLERSNMLMKLRETLLDHTSDGTSVTAPDGISIYPHNKPMAYALIFLLIPCAIFGIIFCREY